MEVLLDFMAYWRRKGSQGVNVGTFLGAHMSCWGLCEIPYTMTIQGIYTYSSITNPPTTLGFIEDSTGQKIATEAGGSELSPRTNCT